MDWVRRLQAIAQSGLTYAKDPYDVERYEQVRKIAAQIAASRSEAAMDHIDALFGAESGYATPKLDIRAVVLDEEEAVLLVKEKEDGLWTLPGGWVDVGESPSESVEREVKEESGYEVRAVRLLALWDMDKHPHPPRPFHIYKLIFQCELLGGDPLAASTETEEVGFFSKDALRSFPWFASPRNRSKGSSSSPPASRGRQPSTNYSALSGRERGAHSTRHSPKRLERSFTQLLGSRGLLRSEQVHNTL